MKYSEKNKPLVCMQTNSTCYKGTSEMEIKGILWHSTGANNPTIKRYVQPSDNAPDKDAMLKILGVNRNHNDWNHIERSAGLNCWIGKLADGSVATVQTMPWNYKPWGCGSGAKGSCNNGWIQFEICEDDLKNENYFKAVYKEACEITAYLCKMFNIDPKGTVEHAGVKVPTILCHQDSYKLKLGSNHSDIYHWFDKYNKSMETVRQDVADLLNPPVPAPAPIITTEMYRVRKTWADSKSQIGAYSQLEYAIEACDKAGSGYHVYNSKGVSVYPEEKITQIKPVETPKVEVIENDFKILDEVKLKPNAKYSSGKAIKSWVFDSKLYIRDIKENDYVISTLKSGAITGTVPKNAVVPYTNAPIKSYDTWIGKVTASVLNVRAGAGTQYKVVSTIKKNLLYPISNEKDGWGYIKDKGWVSLKYIQKVK